jgi:hypothetical protein
VKEEREAEKIRLVASELDLNLDLNLLLGLRPHAVNLQPHSTHFLCVNFNLDLSPL